MLKYTKASQLPLLPSGKRVRVVREDGTVFRARVFNMAKLGDGTTGTTVTTTDEHMPDFHVGLAETDLVIYREPTRFKVSKAFVREALVVVLQLEVILLVSLLGGIAVEPLYDSPVILWLVGMLCLWPSAYFAAVCVGDRLRAGV